MSASSSAPIKAGAKLRMSFGGVERDVTVVRVMDRYVDVRDDGLAIPGAVYRVPPSLLRVRNQQAQSGHSAPVGRRVRKERSAR